MNCMLMKFLLDYVPPTIQSANDELACYNLPICKAYGQCYNGSINMAGSRNGVARQIQEKESWLIFTHYYEHALKFAAMTSLKLARIRCVAAQIASFDFFNGPLVGELLLCHKFQKYNVNKILKHRRMASMLLETLASLRNVDHFRIFFTRIGMMAEEKGIAELLLPRRCKHPPGIYK